MNQIEKLKERVLNKPYSNMELEVIKEMFSFELDPFNPKDVRKYWKAKGVDLDAIQASNPPRTYWSYNK